MLYNKKIKKLECVHIKHVLKFTYTFWNAAYKVINIILF